MLEFDIFVILFILSIIAALVSATGWLFSSERSEKLTIELFKAKRDVHLKTSENEKLKAENNFYKNQLEEKKDEQKSN